MHPGKNGKNTRTGRKNAPLRIAMLGHKRVPSREGGVEVVVGELSSRMAAKGCSVTCYNRRGRHVGGAEFDSERLHQWRGVRLCEVWTLDRRGLAAMTASLSAALRAAFGKYDVVHFHAEGPCAMLWLPKLFGKRCVATVHGLDHMRAKWGAFASWYIKSGERCAVRFADEIIVLSESVRQYFLDNYGRECVLIPNGVTQPERAEPSLIAEKYGLGQDSYILYLGRLVPEKGLKYLIEAYRGLDTDKKLVIAGGSSDTEAFEAELRALCSSDPRIIFTGFVQGRQLSELYSGAYVYVLPSDLEGMPLSLLEAMSYGNCVLCSDIPECAHLVGEHGVTFRRADAADLREKLERLCSEPELVRTYKENAAEYITKKYDWDDVTSRTLALYGIDAVAEGAEYDTDEAKKHEDLARK